MKTIYKLVLKSYLGPMVLTFFIIMFAEASDKEQ